MCKILEYQIPRGNIFVDFYKVMPEMFLIWTEKVRGNSVSSGLTFFVAFFLKFSKSPITIF